MVKPNVTSHIEVVRVQLHIALHLGVVRVVGEVPRHGKVAEGRQLLAGVRRRCLRHAALAGRHVVKMGLSCGKNGRWKKQLVDIKCPECGRKVRRGRPRLRCEDGLRETCKAWEKKGEHQQKKEQIGEC